MAPSATEPTPIDIRIKDVAIQKKDTLPLPEAARSRLEKAGIDLSKGYPERPASKSTSSEQDFLIEVDSWVETLFREFASSRNNPASLGTSSTFSKDI